MKYIIVLVTFLQILSCDRFNKKEPNDNQKKEVILEKESPLNYYVNAKSGLNYRDKPKGVVLGLFPLNTALQVVENSGVFQNIKDENTVLNGEWLGVLNNKDTVYVFSGFLSAQKITVKSIEFNTDSLGLIHTIENQKRSKIKLWSNNFYGLENFFLSNDKNFILISKQKEIDGELKTIKVDTLLSNEYTYTEIHKESFTQRNVNGQEYFFFSLKETFKGRAITGRDIIFFMINLKTLNFHELVYSGEPTLRCNNCIDGDFQENSNIELRPKLKKSLYDYALTSKHIYVPSEEEKNIGFYKNYVQKWYRDNKTKNIMATGHSDIPDIIYSTYYEKDIFKFTGDYGSDFIENDQYKVVNFFNGSLLAYDKVKELYFPVFVESCNEGCSKEITFINENKINVKYDHTIFGGISSVINIDKIIFTNK